METYRDHFGLSVPNVRWLEKGRMGWSGVLPRFRDELSDLKVPPEVLVLHGGCNDLGLVDPKNLVSQMEVDLRRLRKDENHIFSSP